MGLVRRGRGKTSYRTATMAALRKTSLIASFWNRVSLLLFLSLPSRETISASSTPGRDKSFYSTTRNAGQSRTIIKQEEGRHAKRSEEYRGTRGGDELMARQSRPIANTRVGATRGERDALRHEQAIEHKHAGARY